LFIWVWCSLSHNKNRGSKREKRKGLLGVSRRSFSIITEKRKGGVLPRRKIQVILLWASPKSSLEESDPSK